jgi:hypothetical protein
VLRCAKHDRHPEIINGENDFSLICCCEQFKKQCTYLINKMLSE